MQRSKESAALVVGRIDRQIDSGAGRAFVFVVTYVSVVECRDR
jgi:hypothetical protein